jgi:hypothetical protein
VTTWVQHQLSIHIDYSLSSGELEIRYDYPLSELHPLKEQVIRAPRSDIRPEFQSDLEYLAEAIAERIPKPKAVRVPHAKIIPSIRKSIMTIVIQYQQRKDRMPIACMCYLEEIEEIESREDKQVGLEREGFSPQELEVWDHLSKAIRKITWEDYKRLLGTKPSSG